MKTGRGTPGSASWKSCCRIGPCRNQKKVNQLLIFTKINIEQFIFFCAALYHHFLPLLRKRDLPYEYLMYWTTLKGSPRLTQCHWLLRPWWMGIEGHFFPFCFITKRVLPKIETILLTS